MPMRVFIAASRQDQIIVPENTELLAEILTEAEVDLRWRNTGHGLTYEEVGGAKAWLSDMLSKLGS